MDGRINTKLVPTPYLLEQFYLKFLGLQDFGVTDEVEARNLGEDLDEELLYKEDDVRYLLDFESDLTFKTKKTKVSIENLLSDDDPELEINPNLVGRSSVRFKHKDLKGKGYAYKSDGMSKIIVKKVLKTREYYPSAADTLDVMEDLLSGGPLYIWFGNTPQPFEFDSQKDGFIAQYEDPFILPLLKDLPILVESAPPIKKEFLDNVGYLSFSFIAKSKITNKDEGPVNFFIVRNSNNKTLFIGQFDTVEYPLALDLISLYVKFLDTKPQPKTEELQEIKEESKLLIWGSALVLKSPEITENIKGGGGGFRLQGGGNIRVIVRDYSHLNGLDWESSGLPEQNVNLDFDTYIDWYRLREKSSPVRMSSGSTWYGIFKISSNAAYRFTAAYPSRAESEDLIGYGGVCAGLGPWRPSIKRELDLGGEGKVFVERIGYNGYEYWGWFSNSPGIWVYIVDWNNSPPTTISASSVCGVLDALFPSTQQPQIQCLIDDSNSHPPWYVIRESDAGRRRERSTFYSAREF